MVLQSLPPGLLLLSHCLFKPQFCPFHEGSMDIPPPDVRGSTLGSPDSSPEAVRNKVCFNPQASRTRRTEPRTAEGGRFLSPTCMRCGSVYAS